MKARRGTWYWFEPIYRVSYALLSCPGSEAAKRVRSVLPEDVADELQPILSTLTTDGRFVLIEHDRSGLIVVLWFPLGSDTAVVAHEAFHAVRCVLEKKGLAPTSESEEAYAYLMEWLVREIGKRRCGAGEGKP